MRKACGVPTKLTTVPRLELSTAVIEARTCAILRNELEIDGLQEYFCTDSKVVLGYINNDARWVHVFVANRIKSITYSKQGQNVHSEDNPAVLF